MEVLIGAVAVGVLLFGCFVLAYREGLRLGMRAAKGVEPAPVKTPVQLVREVQTKKEADREAATFDAFMNYDGYTDRERAWMRGGDGV